MSKKNCKISGSLENFNKSRHDGEFAQYYKEDLVNYLKTLQEGEIVPISL